MSLLAAGAALTAAACPLPAAAAAAPTFAPTRFSVEVTGSGPDVILIPGLTSGRDVWKGTVAALPGYRYHLVQVSGFAGEPARGNARGPVVAGVAEELSRYIAANGLREPAVIGHSMGGTIALTLAARHPDQVGKLMVVDMLPQPSGLFGSTPESADGIAEAIGSLAATPGGGALVGSLAGMFGDANGSDPEVVARAVQELAATDLRPALPRIAAPLTVVYASADPQTRAARDATFAAAYRSRPGTRFVRIDDSSHMVMFDQPAKLKAAIAAFLRD